LPPQVLIAIAVAVSLTIVVGIIMYWVGTREVSEAKKHNYQFIGVTMIFTAISFTLVILPWFAILAIVFIGMIGALCMSFFSGSDIIRSQSMVAFFMFYCLFIVFTGNLGFLTTCLVGIGVGSYFYWYSSKDNLTEVEKYNNLFLGSMVCLPSIALSIIAAKAIKVRGLF
jgi:ABC-type multidrug transport system permease subunit